MPLTKRVRFYGRVQGVYFRRRTRDAASEYGVSGWVKNLPDGSVEAELSGDTDKVQRLIDYCQNEMPVARVDRVEITDMGYIDHIGFKIKY
ncbi:acylphosphatase [uncultured archaeon]|nr:acylphosphatase [uncultured archaeon]